jgi:hypothetical protein
VLIVGLNYPILFESVDRLSAEHRAIIAEQNLDVVLMSVVGFERHKAGSGDKTKKICAAEPARGRALAVMLAVSAA